MELRFSRTVAADGVDVNTGADHVVSQDRGIFFISCAGCDDLCALNGLFRRFAGDDRQAFALEVSSTFRGGVLVSVIQPNGVDPAHCLESQTLELRLRAIADHGHGGGVLRGQIAPDQSRGCCRAQCGQQRHLGQQRWIASIHIRQKAKGPVTVCRPSEVFLGWSHSHI